MGKASNPNQAKYGPGQTNPVSGVNPSDVNQPLEGTSIDGTGVEGTSTYGTGVLGRSQYSTGVSGSSGNISKAASNSSPDLPTGVVGTSAAGYGVFGFSLNSCAIYGVSTSSRGAILGFNNGLWDGASIPAIPAISAMSAGTGISASGNPAGYFVGKPAGYFQGDIQVTGDVILLSSNGDLAEDFDLEDSAAQSGPGTVLVISPHGELCACTAEYDSRVAGVLAGAGGLAPAIVLQRIASSGASRGAVALVGKAYCKVDATRQGIEAGDLLTTSSTPGHAMKARNKARATGAILGKALCRCERGLGLIPVLLTSR